jgi:hypothetical protein
MNMPYQIVIINEQGATLRAAPSIGSAEIAKISQGDPLEIDRLLYSLPQPFNTTHIPEYWAAVKAKTLRGDVWAQMTGLRQHGSQLVTAYVPVRVALVVYGVVIGNVEALYSNLDRAREHEIRQDEIDRMFFYLSKRRVDLEND